MKLKENWYWLLFLVSAIYFVSAVVFCLSTEDIQKLHNEILYPVVLVRTESGSGSGTVVYSGKDGGEDFQTFVLTADHVIDSACSVKTEWDPMLGADVRKEVRSTIWTEFYVYKNLSRAVGTTVIETDIIARDPKSDIALLKLRSITPVKNVAPLWPKAEIKDLRIFQPVYSVGAQLGHPPLATHGQIQNLDIEIEGEKYVLITAPIIYGSSGGTAYVFHEGRNRWEVFGIPARGSVAGYGQMVTHLGKCVGPWSIYKFLERNCYEFIYDDSQSIQDCEKRRKEKAEKEKRMLPRAVPGSAPSSPWGGTKTEEERP